MIILIFVSVASLSFRPPVLLWTDCNPTFFFFFFMSLSFLSSTLVCVCVCSSLVYLLSSSLSTTRRSVDYDWNSASSLFTGNFRKGILENVFSTPFFCPAQTLQRELPNLYLTPGNGRPWCLDIKVACVYICAYVCVWVCIQVRASAKMLLFSWSCLKCYVAHPAGHSASSRGPTRSLDFFIGGVG